MRRIPLLRPHMQPANFFPLAHEGDVKAQHNLAMIYYGRCDYGAAYTWFKKAADQGFKPSKNNLCKMNLLCLLLPYELLTHILSFFTMNDLSCFNAVSHKDE